LLNELNSISRRWRRRRRRRRNSVFLHSNVEETVFGGCGEEVTVRERVEEKRVEIETRGGDETRELILLLYMCV